MTGRPLPDLRLAGVAAGCWLAALAGLYLAAAAGAVAAAGAFAAAAGVAGLRRRAGAAAAPRRRGRAAAVAERRADVAPGRRGGAAGARWLVAAVLLGAAAGFAATAARVAARDADPLAGLARDRAHVRVELVVTDDPRQLRTGPAAAGRGTWLVTAELHRLVEPPTRLSARILVLGTDPGWRPLLPGQRVAAEGRLAAPRGGDLRAAVLTTAVPPRPLGRAPLLQRLAGGLREGLQRACAPLPDEPGGLLPGLVVGDTRALEPAVAADFRATGMTHLLAVSGSNVAIVVGFVLLLARWAGTDPRVAAGLCALALAGFVVLVRPSPSVLRAAAMGAVGLAALAAGRRGAALPALGATVALLVLVDPELAGSPGFALSVSATAGLLLLAPAWRDRLRTRGVPAGLAEALAVPAAAQLACAPVVAALSGTIGLVAVPANLVAVPAVAPATVLGVAAALLSVGWPAGAAGLAWLAGWPARWLVLVAETGARSPVGSLPWPAGAGGGLLLAALLVAVAVAGRRRLPRRLLALVAAAALAGALPVRLVASGWPPPGWLVVACDVGQGDAVVLPVAAGRAVVVDAGPDPEAVDGCLRRLGVRHVSALVVSHFHADHVGGVAGVFRDRSVGAVLVPAYREPAGGRAAVAAQGVALTEVGAGAAVSFGALRLVLLGPVERVSGTRSDANNHSLVVRAERGRHRVLLAGDAEEDEQRAVLAAAGPDGVRADVLKVAHHGSAYQAVELTDAVAPAVALVCVGAGNGYGHPSPSVLARLARGGARVLRTDTGGDLAVVADGDTLAVAVRGPGPRGPP
jgi:competence protein ComEC